MEETYFNINLGYGQDEITLTIIPVYEYFNVIYSGAIMGTIQCIDGYWDFVKGETLKVGNFPLYSPKLEGERLKIVLDENTIDAIGREIELYYHDEEPP